MQKGGPVKIELGRKDLETITQLLTLRSVDCTLSMVDADTAESKTYWLAQRAEAKALNDYLSKARTVEMVTE